MAQIDSKQFSSLFQYMQNVTEFKTTLNDISKTWDQLILLSQLGSTGLDMSHTKTNFNNLTEELISHLAEATLDKVVNEMGSKAQVAVDIVIRNLFERTADIGFLATDDDIRAFIKKLSKLQKEIDVYKDDIDDTKFRIARNESNLEVNKIIQRFKEYVAKYSVYYDIVLFDSQGKVLAKLDDSTKIEKTNDTIIDLAKDTQDDYIETYKYHDFLPNYDKSLVYTYKVTDSNESDEIIGYLSLCFKFENEMEGIFSRLVNKSNKETILLLDKEGVSIASSDPYHIPVGAKLDIETEEMFKITSFAGRDYIVKTCNTNGYEGFLGLGWLGHIMIPLESAFSSSDNILEIEKEILDSIMKNQEIFKKEMLDVPVKASSIQDELDRAVWNGNVSQSGEGSTLGGADFSRLILREVRQTGENTKTSFNIAIEKLNQTIITSLLDTATFLASLSIDIMDRNLYERANDCRWWALTSTFKQILSKEDILNEKDTKEIEKILKYINELYTVYTNLLVYDKNGVIVAVSDDTQKELIGKQLTNEWVFQTLKLENSSKYSVSAFEATPLYGNKHSYIYGAVISDENINNKAVGGIGIVFDSTPQFYDMLKDALPKVDETMFSFFVEKDSKTIVSCTNEKFTIGEILDIDESFYELKNGDCISKIINFEDKYYIVGGCCSSGYREYKSHTDSYKNDILSFVFIEAGELEESEVSEQEIQNHYYNYQIQTNEPIEEIATFYVGKKWVGIPQSQVIEAVGLKNLETPISTEIQNHFKGTISHKNYIVSVIDISSFIKNNNNSSKNDIVIVNYEGSDGKHTLGIIVDRLGEIMKVPKKSIKPFENHLISGGMIGESIVQPPQDTKTDQLLTILNIAKLNEISQ